MATPTQVFVTRVRLKNWKSIAECDVKLSSLSFLVGPNGAGKSNFVDSLRFVGDALRSSLDHAIRDRGGINEVRRRSGGHPTHFTIEVEFALRADKMGRYMFSVGSRPKGGYEVSEEECVIYSVADPLSRASFKVEAGQVVRSTIKAPPAAARDRLYLVNASGLPEFREAYENLSRMGFYNLNPDEMRDLQSPDAGELLKRDGSNIASVLAKLALTDPHLKKRLEEYLSLVVPGVRGVEVKVIGPKETLEFRQLEAGSKHPWKFLAANMSDGTLRALGILVALFQPGHSSDATVPLVGIEEPEVALHPAAASILFDSLAEASRSRQVLATSHSPDLLDHEDIETDAILAVVSVRGKTVIGHLDEPTRQSLRDHLYTAGELLRMNMLVPQGAALAQRSLGEFE